jgi:short-subunit dehydrogenase
VSSGSSLAPCPYLTIYSATKAYITQWSRSLSLELRDTRPAARVITLTPYYIATKMSGMTPTMTVPSAIQWVKSAMSLLHLGETCGYVVHDMMKWLVGAMSKEVMEGYMLSANRPH